MRVSGRKGGREGEMDRNQVKENNSSCFIRDMSLAIPYPFGELNQYTQVCNAVCYIIILTRKISDQPKAVKVHAYISSGGKALKDECIYLVKTQTWQSRIYS